MKESFIGRCKRRRLLRKRRRRERKARRNPHGNPPMIVMAAYVLWDELCLNVRQMVNRIT